MVDSMYRPLSKREEWDFAKIKAAYEVLFDCELKDWSSLVALTNQQLKHVFRAKVKCNHPDLGHVWNRDLLNTRLRSLNEAYQYLSRLLSSPNLLVSAVEAVGNIGQTLPPAQHQRSYYDYYYRGMVPRRRLRFGEYLFFTSRISWRTLVQALLRQRQDGWNKEFIPAGPSWPLGQYFCEARLFSGPELMVLLGEQRHHNRRF